ncbi:MAG: hypothetical protein Tsb0020_29170 [Haliangiales bacterium]
MSEPIDTPPASASAEERHALVCDGYDREVFGAVLADRPALSECRERLGRLLPHPEPLLCDLFCALFKLNLVLRPPEELAAAAQLNHRLVSAVIEARDLPALRARTELRADECAALLPGLVERILTALKRDFYVGPQELLDAAEAAHDEAELADLEAQRAHLDALSEDLLDELDPVQIPDNDGDDDDSDDSDEVGDIDLVDDDDLADDEAGDADPASQRARRARVAASLERDIQALRARVEAARSRQARAAQKLTRDLDDSIGLKVSTLPDQLEQADELSRSLGLSSGQAGRVGASRRLELGERLMRSQKLKLLAKLVGAFREVAFEARRKRVARSPQTLHAIGAGDHLDRLLPSELLGLPAHRGPLHRDFVRRLVEGQLLEYELHGASSRGPMVVCVDGSGSMQGSKEIWAKAVALTLMEIARREKRRCLAIVFSAGHALFEVELLGGQSRWNGRAQVLDDNVLSFAEHFPGGGTDFEQPLARALDAVATGTFRRGDIVFITDGHAHVSDALVERVERAKKRHRFKIRGVVVDVADSSAASLERFCDEVRQVSDMAADAMTDLFSAV